MTYALSGKIAKGQGLASRLGFSTINVEYELHSLLPPVGIYAGLLRYRGNEYAGVISFGSPKNLGRPKLEIYCFKSVPLTEKNKDAACAFLEKLSDFTALGTNALKKKIAQDIRSAKQFFSKNPRECAKMEHFDADDRRKAEGGEAMNP